LSDTLLLFLSDILPIGYQAVLNAEVGLGRSVAIFGAGPVGLTATACARMMDAARIYRLARSASACTNCSPILPDH
jgi:threonine dehydrogenase-like Zn-dependent dehydrogenase